MMMTTFGRVWRDERGMSLVFVGMGFMAFLVATTLAIDVGLFMNSRSQAQNSADAGALAGAVALVFDNYGDRSPGGPAVQSALAAATANRVAGADVSVTEADVTFLNDPAGQPNRVHVNVYRTTARGNQVPTLMGALFGVASVNIDAAATAEATPADAATCVKPWAVPDKWVEVQTPAWDADDTFDLFNNHGVPLPNPDVYRPASDLSTYTGYRPDPAGSDYGTQVMLKAGNPAQAIDPSHFYPIALPPNTGASWYNENIPGCWPGVMQMGDLLPVEPGNMTGPTSSGTEDLIALDPNAYWDTARRRVVSSFNPSPRIVVLPVFDPVVYEQSRQTGRQDIQVANLVGFFIEDMSGGSVIGRLVPATGLIRGGSVPGGAYLKSIRLVE